MAPREAVNPAAAAVAKSASSREEAARAAMAVREEPGM